MNVNDFEILTWDSDFFGVKVAKIIKNVSSQKLKKILETLKEQHVELVYYFVDNLLSFVGDELYSCQLVDQKITYIKQINRSKISFSTPPFFYVQEVNQQLIKLAIQSGEYSRFKQDENIPIEKFKELYELWIRNSISHKIAKKVIAYGTQEKIQGVITCSQFGEIGIISVSPHYQKKGIGKALMSMAENYYCQQDFKELKVVTQASNINACQFYEKLGYTKMKQEYVYHLWLRKKS